MTAVLFISMVILLILGVPIAFVLVGSSALALVADGGTNLSIIIQRMFSGTGSFTLLAIPFFVLAGNLMSAGGISRRLVNLCNSFLGHIPGGLAMVAVATCAFFAAISGSSAAKISRSPRCRRVPPATNAACGWATCRPHAASACWTGCWSSASTASAAT